jgi:hypothetical protein
VNDPQASAAVGKPKKPDLETRLYQTLGRFDGYYTRPPGADLGIDLPDGLIARTLNDGFELWVGTPDRWLWFCRTSTALRLARFAILNWWILGTWCGLRRWLWYKLLTRQCNRHRRPK